MKLCRWLLRLGRADDGTAALELALVLPMLTAVIMPLVDVGMAAYIKMQVQNGAQAGAEYAAEHGWNSGANTTAITSAVTNATALAAITASPGPAEVCYCLTGTSFPTATVPCASTCPNNSTPGTYVRVNAQATYTTLFPYPMIPSPMTFTSQATVRVVN